MTYPLEEIEGIGFLTAEILRECGIGTTYDLLVQGKNVQKRRKLAKLCKVKEEDIKHYVSYADLLRVDGIAGELAELLTEAGIESLQMLQQSDPRKLTDRIITLNEKRRLTTHTPLEETMRTIIERSKEYKPIIEG